MPNTGFMYAYWGQGGYFSREKLLVHRDTAEVLIEEKVLSRKNLVPVLLYKSVPAGYREVALNAVPKPGRQHIDDMQKDYSEFIKKPRPEWKATEKEALRRLREAKRERKEDFNKRPQKKTADTLAGTPYQAILPYYLVADGGSLSDEYEFMAYAETSAENEEFSANMAKEELIENTPEGNVIARCPDGDVVIVGPDGTVARVSHEVPEVVEEWPSLAQFFVDTIEI